MATYGSFPGVRVTTQSGGITSVAIGEEEKLVLFGESFYDASGEVLEGDSSLDTQTSQPYQINARREADARFGEGSEIADAMKEALANGANIDFLYGVAVPRKEVGDVTATTPSGDAESVSTQTGTLANVEINANTDEISVLDVDGTPSVVATMDVEFRYSSAPPTPTDADTIYINPLTGEYAADSAPSDHFEFNYRYNDYAAAFSASDVRGVVNEDETGVYAALSDSDAVSASLQGEVDSLRTNYKLVNAISVAEPNDSQVLPDSETDNLNGGADARYDTSAYSTANNSVAEEYYYKFAPGRLQNDQATIAGGVGGLFAGNPITDPIYNDVLQGYSGLEQTFSKTEADEMRAEDVIPVRSGGTLRVQGNRSTAYSVGDAVAADFWLRRITDRVILIGKQVGDAIIGRINDEDTRQQAERLISAEMRSLVQDRLIRSNADETNWSVDVYESSANANEVKIDIAFTPYGIVKQVDETITVDTGV